MARSTLLIILPGDQGDILHHWKNMVDAKISFITEAVHQNLSITHSGVVGMMPTLKDKHKKERMFYV